MNKSPVARGPFFLCGIIGGIFIFIVGYLLAGAGGVSWGAALLVWFFAWFVIALFYTTFCLAVDHIANAILTARREPEVWRDNNGQINR